MSDLFDDDSENTESQKSEFAKMFEGSLAKVETQLKLGDKLKCEILSVGRDEVFVNTGTVNDGVVSKSDFGPEVNLKTGETVDLFVVQMKAGQILLSPKPTAKNLADDLEDAFDMMLPIEGKVTEICNGGFRVLMMGKTAFCPMSQIDSKRVDQPEVFIGKKFEFLITQFSERGRNIVVSRRKILDEQKGLSESTFRDEQREGSILPGVVTRLEKFGAFVEIAPQIDGLVHISEISWSRLQDPSEVLKTGQQVTVKILKIESLNGKMKISLSIKQAEEEPWKLLPSQIKVGTVVEGKVTRCLKFGAFVELAPGIEGLIPLSEMSYTKRVVRSDEFVREGEKALVMIKEINTDDKKILLSLKDAGADPFTLAIVRYPIGSLVEGIVEKREPFGLFIQIEPGVTGLLPKSQAKDVPDFPYDRLKPGEKIRVQIREIQAEARKISLGPPSEIGDDSWKGFVSGQKLGTLGDQFKNIFNTPKKN